MALTDAPTVRIGDETISNAWSLTHRIGLGGLKITFGRESHLDEARPAQLYCEILDTDGHLPTWSHLTGKPITVTRAAEGSTPARVIFRGRVDDFDVELIHVNDPDLFYRRRVWKIGVTASDKLAELAKSALPGPGTQFAPAIGPDYWETESASTRINKIMSQGANKIIGSLQWQPPYSDAAPDVRMVPWSEQRSALDLIEALYSAHPLGYPIYDASSNAVRIGKPAASAGLALVWEGGKLRLRVPDGHAIPASRVVVPDGLKATAGIDEAIDIVQVAGGMTRISDDGSGGFRVEFTETITEHSVPGYDMQIGGRREHRVVTDYLYRVDDTTPTEPGGGSFTWPFPLSTVTSGYGWRESTNSFHEGIDFSYDGIGGAAIHPVGAGTVASAMTLHSGWGNTIVIDHGNGLSTRYAHMQAPTTLAIGAAVTAESTLGFVGNTGNSYGDHLHLETYVNGSAIDPVLWMQQYGEQGASVTPAPAAEADEGLWQSRIAAGTAAALGKLTGAAGMPRVRLDWRNFDYESAVTQSWLDTVCRQVPIYFPGSVFNVMLDAAALHQIIGGTLVYHDGWTLDATLAPALGHGNGLTVAQLVTIDAPTISDYDDDITIADLGNVTIGAT